MMLKYVTLAAVAAVGVLGNPTSLLNQAMPSQPKDGSWPPSFCNGIECPKYDVEKKGDGFEIRLYEPTLFATTEVKGMDMELATRTGFMRLFKYISGENESEEKVEMTAPVRTVITPGQGPFCESTFKISFYVPEKWHTKEGPPKPSSSDVYIEKEEKDTTVAVLSYPGFSSSAKVQEHGMELSKLLQKDGVKFTTEPYAVAQYDAPFRLFNRHNEIWFYVE